MFCFQCQETFQNTGCTRNGMCGKKGDTADLMDVLMYAVRGVAVAAETSGRPVSADTGAFILGALFTTITNANFDPERIAANIRRALQIRDAIKAASPDKFAGVHSDLLDWTGSTVEDFQSKTVVSGVLATENADVRSLRELLIYGLKGIAAYGDHAKMLGFEKPEIYAFVVKALASTTKNLSVDEMVGLVLECGNLAVTTMALLDEANTSTYGNPQVTEVNIGVGSRPGILVSGHDLRDMDELLKQSAGQGIDIYTHSEMLPAHYYPELKKYPHLVGNYGGSWWHQGRQFGPFNGPILMTTNCIIPVGPEYKDRIYTTGMAGYPGVKHIADRADGKAKDFSEIIALAKTCPPPTELERGKIVGGFAHNQVLALADKVVAAVKSGAIKRFVVMAGCDGRQKDREYFTDVAAALPKDTVILTAGCAKYRYNKLNLGDIGGIPRVLDAGQCNDSYSLAVIALKLKEVFGLEDVNQLPLSFDIAWYEQKAVAVLLALLALGFKGIRIGPTLPAFLSPGVAEVLVKTFDLKVTTEPQADIDAMMAGK
jgi:hydroxylamine reductase